MNFTEPELITFLPHFLDDELILISTEISLKVNSDPNEVRMHTNEISIQKEPIIESNLVVEKAIEINPIVQINSVSDPIIEVKKVDVLEEIIQKESLIETKIIIKKVIILVSYIQGVPDDVSVSLYKIFEALNCPKSDIELINVTVSNPNLLASYQFQYLVLMGGKGKTLNFLADYTGERNILEVGNIQNSKVIFADKLDLYLKPENVALKKLFWNTLKSTIIN